MKDPTPANKIEEFCSDSEYENGTEREMGIGKDGKIEPKKKKKPKNKTFFRKETKKIVERPPSASKK